jgi:hypothetical protein
MSSPESLREYLIELGYKNDEAGYRRFTDAIERSSKQLRVLSAGIEAGMVGLAVCLGKAAEGFEKLYYQSSRTGSSAKEIRAMGYAASQLGSSYDDAVQSLEAFSLKLRETNGGQEKLLRNFGVQTRDAKGNLRDTVDLLREFDAALSKKYGGPGSRTYGTRLAYERQAGISEQFARALANPEFEKQFRERERIDKAFGIDNEAIENAKNFSQEIRHLKTEPLGARRFWPGPVLMSLNRAGDPPALPATGSTHFLTGVLCKQAAG